MAGIELGCPYYFYEPSGVNYVALNVPADANFIGYVKSITGLDMSGVRENAQTVVAGDGGYHGPFWRDRRPWTFSGFIVPSFSLVARDQAQEKLEGILGACLRADGTLLWTPADTITRKLLFRCQQPVRVSEGQSNVQKMFQVAAVSADWRAVSNTAKSQTITHTYLATTGTCVNSGNCDAAPIFTFTGPIINPFVINNVTNKKVSFAATIGSETVTIDLTGTYPVISGNVSGDLSGGINPLTTDWDIAVARSDWTPGQTFSLGTPSGNYGNPAGSGNSCTLTVGWRDSWL